MIKIISLSVAGALFACGLSAVPAHALATRTFVSGHGADSGACGAVTTPCRTFAFALAQTLAGGEIDVLDPAGYGSAIITKAISILNDGVGVAGIRPGSGNGVTINAGANDSVHLRGLTIEGFGSATNGILFNTGGNLEIENCVVRGFANAGINISPSTSNSFSVSDTIASNNGVGILVHPTGTAVVKGVLNKVTANNNFIGIFVDGTFTQTTLNVTIVDSVASDNGTGVAAASVLRPPGVAVMLRDVVASNNRDTGLDAAAGNPILRLAHSVVTVNSTGVMTGRGLHGGGRIFSYGDNDIDGNTNDNTGDLTPLPKH